MFTRKEESSEIAQAMQRSLVSEAVEKQTAGLNKLATAMEHLNAAAEIFDEVGLVKQAEFATALLESLAAKKKKKPVKSKSKSKSKSKNKLKSKKPGSSTKDLTSEKMVENLRHKGWVFNADDANYDEHHDDCMCMDCSNADDNHYDIETNDSNYADNDTFEKDEREQDLAKMMHQIEEEDDSDFEDEEEYGRPLTDYEQDEIMRRKPTGGRFGTE